MQQIQQTEQSLADAFRTMPEAKRRAFVADLPEAVRAELHYDWRLWGRPKQMPPPGDWDVWMILAGRGFGKTRCGMEFFRSLIEGPTPLKAAPGAPEELVIIGNTPQDILHFIIEGKGGFFRNCPPDQRPVHNKTDKDLTWPNGCRAVLFSAQEPEGVRGASAEVAWCDEMAKWRYIDEVWENLEYAMREVGKAGRQPRTLITTTPKPKKLIRRLASLRTTVLVQGSTYENQANLADAFVRKLRAQHEGTRKGRQEIHAEILDDNPRALWRRDNFDEHRIWLDEHGRPEKKTLPDMQRVLVGVDPGAGGDGESAAETGIVAAGLGVDGRGYVLMDDSCRLSAAQWARRTVAVYDLKRADGIIAEKNNGGDMVEALIRTVRSSINVETVWASRGKVTRAEPIAALYEQGRISHVGELEELEEQLMAFTPTGIEGMTTADRGDALVWVLWALFDELISDEPHDQDEDDEAGARRPLGAIQGGWMAG